MVFLDHGQNLHIHAVRANILMSFSVDFRSDRLIWPVCDDLTSSRAARHARADETYISARCQAQTRAGDTSLRMEPDMSSRSGLRQKRSCPRPVAHSLARSLD